MRYSSDIFAHNTTYLFKEDHQRSGRADRGIKMLVDMKYIPKPVRVAISGSGNFMSRQ